MYKIIFMSKDNIGQMKNARVVTFIVKFRKVYTFNDKYLVHLRVIQNITEVKIMQLH